MAKYKIILWDTEVSTATVKGYGNKWDFRYVKEVSPQQLMCYSWKERGSKTINFVSMHDFKTQKELVQSLADLLDSADITVAHNGINFDDKMANTFFVMNGVQVPSPRKSVDTLKVARRKFRFPSNSLADLCKYLKLPNKLSVGYSELEDKFIAGDKKAQKEMKAYNNQDIISLEAIYDKFLPYMDNHPNMGVYMQEPNVCAKCGGKELQRRGVGYRVNGEVIQWWCNTKKGGCGGWNYQRYMEDPLAKEQRSSMVNA